MGGRTTTSSLSTGAQAGETTNIISQTNLLKTDILDTSSKQRTWLRSLEDGEKFDISTSLSTLTVTKMEGTKKYKISGNGIRYNSDGSYTSYRINTEATETVVLRYINNASSVRNRRK